MIIRDNFCQFCIKIYVVTPHLYCLDEMVEMRGHNIWFQLEIRKIIKFSLLSRALIRIFCGTMSGRSFLELYNR